VIFTPTPLDGAWVVDLDRHEDSRGFFARAWDGRLFADRGLDGELAQCSVSRTPRRGTLRGLHWQEAPHAETKLVRCTRGRIWDVMVDLRADSPTYLHHFGIELADDSLRAVYIPRGFAHGFVTLSDHVDVMYQMSVPHAPGSERGARWNDPAFGIAWPVTSPFMSERDASYPDFPARRQ